MANLICSKNIPKQESLKGVCVCVGGMCPKYLCFGGCTLHVYIKTLIPKFSSQPLVLYCITSTQRELGLF